MYNFTIEMQNRLVCWFLQQVHVEKFWNTVWILTRRAGRPCIGRGARPALTAAHRHQGRWPCPTAAFHAKTRMCSSEKKNKMKNTIFKMDIFYICIQEEEQQFNSHCVFPHSWNRTQQKESYKYQKSKSFPYLDREEGPHHGCHRMCQAHRQQRRFVGGQAQFLCFGGTDRKEGTYKMRNAQAK